MAGLFPAQGRSNNNRRYPGIKGKRPDRKEARRQGAIDRAPGHKKHLYWPKGTVV